MPKKGVRTKTYAEGERCVAVTVEGKRCRRKRYGGGKYCYMHRAEEMRVEVDEMTAVVEEGVEIGVRNVMRIEHFMGLGDLRLGSVDEVLDWMFRWASVGNARIRMENDIFGRGWREGGK